MEQMDNEKHLNPGDRSGELTSGQIQVNALGQDVKNILEPQIVTEHESEDEGDASEEHTVETEV
jgi:hypothetical protein